MGARNTIIKVIAAIPATTQVTIQSSLPSRPMSLGGSNDDAVDGINLTSAELAQIVTTPTGTVTIGDPTQTGDITFSGATVATTAGADTTVVQSATGPGTIVLDASTGTALDGNGGTVTLTPGTGSLSATMPDASALLATNGFTATELTLNLALNAAPTPGQNITLVSDSGSPIVGNFTNLANGNVVTLIYNSTPYQFLVSYEEGAGNDLVLQNIPPGPQATFTSGGDITAAGSAVTTTTVVVSYAEVGSSSINTTTFGTGNITVSNGATVTSYSASGDVVTYTITAPGSNWATSTQGSYTISLVAGSVQDTDSVGIAGVASFGSFNVDVSQLTPTTTTLTSSAASSVNNQSVTFTATVVGAEGPATPGGTVTFMDGSTSLGTGAIGAGGVATFTTSTLSVAPHSITAVYTSDGTFDTSTSSAVSQTVAAHAAATHFTVTGATDETAGGTETVIVTALDAYGNTDTGYAGSVAITSSDGHAVLPADSFLTNGTNTFNVTLETAGTQSVTATATVTTSIAGTESGIAVTPAAATHLVVAGAPGGTAGTAETLTVTAEDPYGNTDPSYTGTVHFSSSDGQAVLPADSSLTSGVGSFTVTLETAGTQSVTVTDTATSGITGTESDIAISPGAASQFAVTGIAGDIAGLNQTFTVEARDFFGNVATGYTGTVHFTSSDPRAVLPANARLTNGVGTFSVTLETVGRQSVTATDTTPGGPAGSESGIPVTVAPVSTYVFTGLTGVVTAGVQQSVTISATDPYGNAEPTYSGTVLLTSSDAQAVLPASLSLTGGTGSFLVTFKSSGTQSITGTDSIHNLVTSTDSNILVSAAAATHLVVAGLSGGAAGTPGTLTVTAEDPYGNTATGYTGTVHFTSSDPIAVLPDNSSLTNGVGTFNVTLKTAGAQSVTVADTATTTITGAETGIVVTPLATSQFSVTGASGGVAGTVESVTVTAEDPTETQRPGTPARSTSPAPTHELPCLPTPP